MTIFNNTVNIIDVVLTVIFILSAFVGYKKGLLLTIINIVRYSLGFSLCFYCSNALSQPFYDMFIRERAIDYVNANIVSSSGIDGTLTNIADIKSSLPPFASDLVNLDSITIPSGDDVSTYLVNTIVEPAMIGVAKIVIFLLVYVLFFGATWIIIRLLTKASKRREKHRKEKNKKKSLSKRTNQLLGAIFGVVKSAVLVLAIVTVLKYVQTLVNTNADLYQMLDSSVILNFINDINPFNELIGGII